MKNPTSKFKIFICVAMVLLLAGMAILGFFGFNTTVDFNKSYEITVGVDQNVNNSAALTKQYAEEYMAEKGASFKCYSVQSLDDGNVYIYKFDKNTGIDETEFKTYLEGKLNNDKVFIEVAVSEVVAGTNTQVLNLALALAIGAVAIFVYLLFVEKLASALSVVLAGCGASLLFVALTALSRIPALPFLGACIALAFILSAIFASVITARLKEEVKNTANENLSEKEIADKAANKSILRIALLSIIVLVVAILFAALGRGYFIYLALQILIADVCSVCVAFFATPTLWTALKTQKKGYNK